MQEADEDAYEVQVTKCAPNTEAIFGEFGMVADVGEFVLVEVSITNRDDRQRRYQLRPSLHRRPGEWERVAAFTSEPIKPGDTWVGGTNTVVLNTDEPPYQCSVDVWDSIVDEIDPLD